MADIENLAELLIETGHHHPQAYLDSDGIDPEWALWYAGHLQTRIWDTFGDVPTRSRLVHLLLSAEEVYSADVDSGKGEWPPYYAAFIAGRLS